MLQGRGLVVVSREIIKITLRKHKKRKKKPQASTKERLLLLHSGCRDHYCEHVYDTRQLVRPCRHTQARTIQMLPQDRHKVLSSFRGKTCPLFSVSHILEIVALVQKPVSDCKTELNACAVLLNLNYVVLLRRKL